jgi:hypothetical protein
MSGPLYDPRAFQKACIRTRTEDLVKEEVLLLSKNTQSFSTWLIGDKELRDRDRAKGFCPGSGRLSYLKTLHTEPQANNDYLNRDRE